MLRNYGRTDGRTEGRTEPQTDVNQYTPTFSKRGYNWLVGCFGFNGPLRQYFSLYWAVSQREGERRERIDESKNGDINRITIKRGSVIEPRFRLDRFSTPTGLEPRSARSEGKLITY